MGVKAIHEVTGKIAVVTEGNLKANPYLRVATEKEIQDADEARQIEVFGYVLPKSGKAVVAEPEEPNERWTRANLIAYAANKKIDVDEGLTKAELLKALTEGSK